SKFDVPLQRLRIPPAEFLRMLWRNENGEREALVGVANNYLSRLEDDDAPNEMLMDALWERGLSPRRLARSAVLLLSLGLLCWGVYRLGVRHRAGFDRAVPLFGLAVGRSPAPGPAVEPRPVAPLRSGH